jgi:natural product precursor
MKKLSKLKLKSASLMSDREMRYVVGGNDEPTETVLYRGLAIKQETQEYLSCESPNLETVEAWADCLRIVGGWKVVIYRVIIPPDNGGYGEDGGYLYV